MPPWIAKIADEVAPTVQKQKDKLTLMWTDLVAGEIKVKGPHTLDYGGYSHYFLNSAIKIPSTFKPYFGRSYILGMEKGLLELVGEKTQNGKRNTKGFKGTKYEAALKRGPLNKFDKETYASCEKGIRAYLQKKDISRNRLAKL